MEEVLHYLDLKNQYYEKFYTETTKFLSDAKQEKWDGLEFFVDNRERILNIIRYFDFKISELFEQVDASEVKTGRYKAQVKHLLDRRKELADMIVNVDLELIGRIDEMKSETIRELKKALETKNQIDSYSPRHTDRKKSTPTKDV